MKKLILYVFAALSSAFATACSDHTDIIFDTPFISIADSSGASSATVAYDANNLLSELTVSVNASNNYFTDDITVEYSVAVGDGLTEGVDFKIQPTTLSPLTFTKGTYSLPVRVIWYKRQSLDASKDNTLTFTLTENSAGFRNGWPGPGSIKKQYIFTRQ